MLSSDTLIIHTRMSDLDSQRHINNASYLNYITEAQFSFLKKSGYDFMSLLENQIRLKPRYIYVKYFRQQLPQTTLRIETRAHKKDNGIFWTQELFNLENNELACEFYSNTLLNFPHLVGQLPDEKISDELYNIPEFAGISKRVSLEYEIRHIDLNGFNECAHGVLWRLNEESRWNFMRHVGVPFEDLLANDLSLFWIEGAYRYERDVRLGEKIEVHTWVNRYDKVRIYLNQEIVSNGDRILITEGEFLTVSLSKLRPIRTPDYLIRAIKPFCDQEVTL